MTLILYSKANMTYNKDGDSMKKITILALHLGYGGIEKCITMLANSLCKKYQVEIISTYHLEDSCEKDLNSQIQIRYLLSGNLAKKVESYKINFLHFHWIQLWKELYRDYLKKGKILGLFKDTWASIQNVRQCKIKMIEAIQACDSDIIISTRHSHNEWLGKYATKDVYKIGWEHNHPHGNQKYAKKVIESVKNLDAFVLVSLELKEFYENKVACKCIYIPNAIDDIPSETSNQTEKRIVSVGRLSSEKGYMDLIDVFDLVHKAYPDWHFDIVGDGAERSALEQKIARYYLQEDITLHGFQDKKYINELLLNSSIYVMGSYTESFGIVLLEAFSYGLPCVAFSSAEGANLLISDNWDGYLIKDRNKEQMAKRICELIQNQNRRIIMGNNGRKKADKYQMKEIIKQWLSLIEKDSI